MTFNEFKDKAFKLAKEKGFEAQISYNGTYEFSLRLGNGELDEYKDANSNSISLTVLKDGKIGTASTTIFDTPEKLVEEAITNYEIIDSEEENLFYDGSGKYPEFESYYGEFEKLSVKEKLDRLYKMSETAGKDERIVMVPMAMFAHQTSEIIIANTLGLEKSYKGDGGYAYASVVAKDESPRSGFWFGIAPKPEKLDLEAIGKRAAEEAIAKIGSKSVKSGKYRVIIRSDEFTSLLATMLIPMISAENAQKNMSPLKEKLGEKIGSDIVNIKDIPYYEGSLNNAPFDSEGVPTQEKTILENGVFKTFLYNLKTAKKEGKESTGNALGRGIAPVNMYFEPGKKNFDELVETLGDGIIITSLEGLHSGANPISGEFSLGAQGLKVENGKIVSGVEQITISGNFLDVLSKIEEAGNDMWISFSSTIAPSVIISEIDIAGNA
ncbi:putative Zn-dependent protease-like protein [Marinitoga piezophila KA3]|uniref:Putative Zn-dependent protease-like protein n=1 Tax=Marinitoga piezophila (strain DSM 14283 / JCM 11233 / KA3) TaxID=443254 RepID=H2J7V5_MARPK|nr:TldD/PmbA family protein [Marinitoga piezophila]AEX85446.1 putative Zn-dependent protease-like protein [Marinitoga piezophila KA3]